MEYRSEVCVVGGGPAGSSIANRLALMGHDVLLIEADAFPRAHVGESLPPGILPLLDKLGARADVEGASFVQPRSAVVRWAKQEYSHPAVNGSTGIQVDRGVFDQLLLRAAARAGTRILQPARALTLVRAEPGGWMIRAGTPSGDISLFTKFVIDASGRRGILPGTKQRLSAPTIALYGYWQDVKADAQETRVEAGADRWYWAAPLPDGSWNATVFVSPAYLRGRHSCLADLYLRLLSESDTLGHVLRGRLVTPIRACNASSVMDAQPAGDDWLKVGESALAIDPLSSQGVQTAVAQALAGACVVHTILTNTSPADVAIAFYKERHREAAFRHLELARAQYNEQYRVTPTPFWADRARPVTEPPTAQEPRSDPIPQPDQFVACSPLTGLPLTPVLWGDVIRLARAVSHPLLTRPVAFLADIPLAPLLEGMAQPCTVRQLLRRWSARCSSSTAFAVLQWLWRHRIIDAVHSTPNE